LIRLKKALREAVVLIVVAAALGFIYTAATEKGVFARDPRSKAASRTAADTPSMVSFAEARTLFDSTSTLFVDARHEFDFKLGHIKGAVNVPLAEYDVKKRALEGISRNRLIVAYCDGAGCNSSIELSVRLMKDGFTNVKIFFGGWREWADANLPTEKQP
jgi:rhodanese-related sulfurtransferase